MEQVDNKLQSDSHSAELTGKWLLSEGQVVGIEGQFALVQTQRQSACGGCQSSSSCGTSALAKLFSNSSSAPMRVENRLNAKLGDQVLLKLDESRLVLHAFMAYGLPLIGLFLSAILLKWAGLTLLNFTEGQAELLSILGGVAGMFAGWSFTRRFYKPTMPLLEQVLRPHV